MKGTEQYLSVILICTKRDFLSDSYYLYVDKRRRGSFNMWITIPSLHSDSIDAARLKKSKIVTFKTRFRVND